MTSINSPLGRKVFTSENTMKEFSVRDDEVKRLNEAEENYRREKELKLNPDKQRMSDFSKKRIEILLNLTVLKKEVRVNNTTFVLRTLKANELRQALSAAFKFAESASFEYLFELRRQILSRCIVSIENLDFESFIDSQKLDDKLYFIDNMDDNLAKLLHSAYDELAKESNDKYGIKTEDQAKEVSEDLKK